MKTRDILNTVTRILPGWHVYNDRQFGCITTFDPQAGYEVTFYLPGSDTIRIVRTRYELEYELVEDVTVLDTSDMGEEQALDELAHLLAAPMPRTARSIHILDSEDERRYREQNKDIDGTCQWNYSASGCGKPTVEGTRWCADHIDEWTMLRHSTGDND